ncbi:MAG: tetratricopeptide repeat protein [Planctomycetes bacterium]|nr:tetratricopeptide repeat protein [Planctomycetota bacterium]
MRRRHGAAGEGFGDGVAQVVRAGRRAVELDAGFFQAWFGLGRVLAAGGRNGEARVALQRAAALRPDDARVGEALRALGN